MMSAGAVKTSREQIEMVWMILVLRIGTEQREVREVRMVTVIGSVEWEMQHGEGHQAEHCRLIGERALLLVFAGHVPEIGTGS